MGSSASILFNATASSVLISPSRLKSNSVSVACEDVVSTESVVESEVVSDSGAADVVVDVVVIGCVGGIVEVVVTVVGCDGGTVIGASVVVTGEDE